MSIPVTTASELRLLIFKYAKGQLTMDEKSKLDAFMNRSPENAELVDLLTKPGGAAELLERQARLEKVWEGHRFETILNRYRRKRRRSSLQLYWIAMIVLLLVVGSAYFLVSLLLAK